MKSRMIWVLFVLNAVLKPPILM